MLKNNVLPRKVLLAVMILAVGLAAFPMTNSHAAGLGDKTNPPQPDNTRLETIWARELAAYDRAVTLLDKADGMISKVQDMINTVSGKGWDASAVQIALDSFKDAVQDARPIINSANGIVTSHKGFDANGKVTDRNQAIETAKELGQHLKDARAALGGTGQALRETIQTFRAAHRPTTTTP